MATATRADTLPARMPGKPRDSKPTGYVEYFGMQRMPFDTAPNPDFAYATRAHEIALLRMQDSVEQQMGLALLKGDIGTGKSTLAHLLTQTWAEEPDRYRVALIDDPSAYTPAQFMRLLVGAFGLEASRYVQVNKDLFRGFLLDEYEAGRTVVVLLDEAQTISAPNMATLLYLSNLQTATTKLVQIALLALPNFDRKLSYQPALSSRIATRGTLDPLIAADTVDMMRHRVTVAGGSFERLFPEETRRPIWHATRGVPRKICVLGHNVLFNAYARGLPGADLDCVVQAAKDCEFDIDVTVGTGMEDEK